VAYNFQIGENKIKLLAKYENVNQTVLLPVESILQNAKQYQHALLSSFFSSFILLFSV
jgi:hypothetical protein